MTLSKLDVTILSPTATLLSLNAITMVVCPGVEGDLGIMVGHLPLVTTLRSGTVKIFKEHAVIFAMDIFEEQHAILSVTPHHITIMMEIFCPLHHDIAVKGIEYMPPTLRVESPLYGDYKIDADVMDTMTHIQRQLLQEYLKNHKSTHITKDFLRDLGEKAA